MTLKEKVLKSARGHLTRGSHDAYDAVRAHGQYLDNVIETQWALFTVANWLIQTYHSYRRLPYFQGGGEP